MAGEHDYSRGQRLRALITSFQLGNTFKTVLNQWEANDEPDWPDSEDFWNKTAWDLMRVLVEGVAAQRKEAGRQLEIKMLQESLLERRRMLLVVDLRSSGEGC